MDFSSRRVSGYLGRFFEEFSLRPSSCAFRRASRCRTFQAAHSSSSGPQPIRNRPSPATRPRPLRPVCPWLPAILFLSLTFRGFNVVTYYGQPAALILKRFGYRIQLSLNLADVAIDLGGFRPYFVDGSFRISIEGLILRAFFNSASVFPACDLMSAGNSCSG